MRAKRASAAPSSASAHVRHCTAGAIWPPRHSGAGTIQYFPSKRPIRSRRRSEQCFGARRLQAKNKECRPNGSMVTPVLLEPMTPAYDHQVAVGICFGDGLPDLGREHDGIKARYHQDFTLKAAAINPE